MVDATSGGADVAGAIRDLLNESSAEYQAAKIAKEEAWCWLVRSRERLDEAVAALIGEEVVYRPRVPLREASVRFTRTRKRWAGR